MAYYSKQSLLNAYKTLSTLSADPRAQGATQKVSAIRYILALDMFYKNHQRECDLNTTADAHEYTDNVGKVVSINHECYTSNFHERINRHADYAVGSNFYSVNVVQLSKTNGGERLIFPRRGSNPLMYVQSGKLYWDNDLVDNIGSYIGLEEHKAALVIWLLRNSNKINGIDLYDSSKDALSFIFTSKMVELLMPKKEEFTAYISKSSINCYNEPAYIKQEDLIRPHQQGTTNSMATPLTNIAVNHNINYLQTIFFGSPGTGKSYKIKNTVLASVSDDYIFRTTFHPDTDYASFVGCYKPTSMSNKTTAHKIIGYEALVEKLREYLERSYVDPKTQKSYKNVNKACVVFGFDHYDSIISMLNEDNDEHSIKSLISEAYGKDNTTYDTPLRAGMTAKETMLENIEQSSRIIYNFAPQTFTNAYVKAWLNPSENVYLVIEEINRGNCAQIFGDLFQLLDRDDNGVSEYPIKADADLTKYLQEELGTDHEGISDGKIKLPANLYILATMNTSDQSLFPMDSAFKRRWEWKYVPTSVIGDKKKTLQVESKEETVLLNREQEKKVLRLGMYEYDWSVFLEKINKCITDATHSDDKQLGFWFVKTPKDSNLINIETFVSKVIFYLWTDVFKDFGAKATNPFAFKNAEGGWVVCPFSSFFDPYTGEINLGQIHGFMYNLGIIPELEPEIQAAIEKNIVEEGNPEA